MTYNILLVVGLQHGDSTAIFAFQLRFPFQHSYHTVLISSVQYSDSIILVPRGSREKCASPILVLQVLSLSPAGDHHFVNCSEEPVSWFSLSLVCFPLFVCFVSQIPHTIKILWDLSFPD